MKATTAQIVRRDDGFHFVSDDLDCPYFLSPPFPTTSDAVRACYDAGYYYVVGMGEYWDRVEPVRDVLRRPNVPDNGNSGGGTSHRLRAGEDNR